MERKIGAVTRPNLIVRPISAITCQSVTPQSRFIRASACGSAGVSMEAGAIRSR